jgi:SAM-dependent methyltransferase
LTISLISAWGNLELFDSTNHVSVLYLTKGITHEFIGGVFTGEMEPPEAGAHTRTQRGDLTRCQERMTGPTTYGSANQPTKRPASRGECTFMNYLKRLFKFNSSRYRLWQENAAFAALVPTGALVLDAGAGDAPYKSLFQHAKYESADFERVNKQYAPSTYVCDLQSIPVEGGRFDFIIFNQVMEHLPEPKLVLAELYRVLKPGGKMIYTGPLFYEEHEQPYDFYRYTQFGLRYLINSTGLVIERMDWLEGYFGTVGYELNCMSRYLPYKPRDISYGFVGYGLAPITALLKVTFAACSIVFHRLETRVKFKARGYPKNYVVIVRKAPAEGRT